MLDPIPDHPYQPQMRVHHVTDADPHAFAAGSGTIVRSRPLNDGTFVYLVRTDHDGDHVEWPSYFTIPAGTWARPTVAALGFATGPSQRPPAPQPPPPHQQLGPEPGSGGPPLPQRPPGPGDWRPTGTG